MYMYMYRSMYVRVCVYIYIYIYIYIAGQGVAAVQAQDAWAKSLCIHRTRGRSSGVARYRSLDRALATSPSSKHN